MIADK